MAVIRITYRVASDVPEILSNGFRLEGHVYKGQVHEFAVSLAYYANPMRGESSELQREDAILDTITAVPDRFRT